MSFPDFPSFFKALWQEKGHDPFPWQTMLADRAAEKGWPAAIDLPTASGKTACLDIAVWALAKQAGDEKRGTPRRIWFVVDRRIVVDEAFERAERIAARLADENAPEAVRSVAECLLKLRGLPNRRERPLAVGRLRGGVLSDDRWARIPSQAAILTSTVDQLGSRLLFRGYGHSALAAPIFAGLAGNDSLIMLDEAHCARPFLQTLRAVQMFRSAKWAEVENPTPFHVAVLSATPPGEDDGGKPDVFPADEDERAEALNHPVLQDRLTASKRTVLKSVEFEDKLAGEIAEAAAELARTGTMRVGVIVNRVARAADIAKLLEEIVKMETEAGKPAQFDMALLTGRIRPVERDNLIGNGTLLHRQLRANDPEKLDRPLILVSTQCLEVGADFSFDALVTECAGLDALRQRFGRLARLGRPENSEAIIFIAESALKETDPIYGDALKATWEFLWNPSPKGIATIENADTKQERRSVDFGFEELRKVLPSPDKLKKLLAPTSDAPILLPAHLDLLCQTAPRPHPDPDIGIFLHGKGRTAAEVRVAFRCDFDPHDVGNWEEIASLCPPVAGEMFSVPLHRFRKWLETRAEDTSGDVEGEPDETEPDKTKRSARTTFLICGGREKFKVSRDPAAIYPNSVILLPAPRDKDGLAKARKLGQVLERGFGAANVDVWELAQQRAGKTPALRINRAVLAPWLSDCPPLRELLELLETEEYLADDLRASLDAVREWQPQEEQQPLPNGLTEIFKHIKDFDFNKRGEHPGGGIIIYAKKAAKERDDVSYFVEDDFDDDTDAASEAPKKVRLEDHCKLVSNIAEKLAGTCLGEPAAQVSKAAGDWHDTGKLDRRFQDMLRANAPAGDDADPLAKSPDKPRSREQDKVVREAAGLPDHFRHEMLSAQLAERFCQTELSPHDRELLLHLIASHHGHARPFAPVCEDPALPAIEGKFHCGNLNLSAKERRVLTAPHRLDSGIADRFWFLTRRHGWWGLAHQEAILRLADWYASEHPDTEKQGAQP